MLEYIDKIIVPYFEQARKRHKLETNHSAIVIFDVFKGQCTEPVLNKLEDKNILYVFVPANCTDCLQPLDLSVNKPAKDFMRTKFQEWYSNVILNQLDNDLEEEVDMNLSRMKPLTAQWIIEMHDYFVKHPSIIINGFREAGIQEILKK